MDELLRDFRYNRNKENIVSYFLENPDQLDDLLARIFLHKPYPQKEYASWILIHLINSNKFELQPYYPQLVDVLFETNDQTVMRNVTKSLTLLRHENYRETEFLDLLISFLKNKNNKVALHVYSIYLLIRFVKKYPEIKSEIQEIIDLNYEHKSAAFWVARRNFISKTK